MRPAGSSKHRTKSGGQVNGTSKPKSGANVRAPVFQPTAAAISAAAATAAAAAAASAATTATVPVVEVAAQQAIQAQ